MLKSLLLNIKIFIIKIFIRDREYFIVVIINSKQFQFTFYNNN